MIDGARNWLCFPVIEHDGKVLVSRMDLAKTIEPQLRPQRIPNIDRVQTVVLDPGHGGYDKGATSSYGCEKDFALDVARKLRPLLQAKGLHVIMTRESDAFVPLELRARIANAANNSIFVSIHFNATDRDPNATGFEIYSLTPRGAPSTADDSMALSFLNMQAGSAVDAQSVELSACIYHSVIGHIPEFDRGIKRARFAVLRLTKVPAVLVEGGFLTERGESRLIANQDWRAKLAEAISVGIENYKALADNKQRPSDRRRLSAETLEGRDHARAFANADAHSQSYSVTSVRRDRSVSASSVLLRGRRVACISVAASCACRAEINGGRSKRPPLALLNCNRSSWLHADPACREISAVQQKLVGTPRCGVRTSRRDVPTIDLLQVGLILNARSAGEPPG